MKHSIAPSHNVCSENKESNNVGNAPPLTVAPPPPALKVEVVPVSPGPDYMWTPGWWSWNGYDYIWFGGYWDFPVRPGHVWHDGRFYHGRGVEVIRGHEAVGGRRH
jgi:hypothetical protein